MTSASERSSPDQFPQDSSSPDEQNSWIDSHKSLFLHKRPQRVSNVGGQESATNLQPAQPSKKRKHRDRLQRRTPQKNSAEVVGSDEEDSEYSPLVSSPTVKNARGRRGGLPAKRGNVSLTCGVCGRTLSSRQSLISHLHTQHSISSPGTDTQISRNAAKKTPTFHSAAKKTPRKKNAKNGEAESWSLTLSEEFRAVGVTHIKLETSDQTTLKSAGFTVSAEDDDRKTERFIQSEDVDKVQHSNSDTELEDYVNDTVKVEDVENESERDAEREGVAGKGRRSRAKAAAAVKKAGRRRRRG